MENTFDFSEALIVMKAGGACARRGWMNPNIAVLVQRPDEHSKMTLPYLYMAKTFTIGEHVSVVRFPLELSAESIFAEDWYVISK